MLSCVSISIAPELLTSAQNAYRPVFGNASMPGCPDCRGLGSIGGRWSGARSMAQGRPMAWDWTVGLPVCRPVRVLHTGIAVPSTRLRVDPIQRCAGRLHALPSPEGGHEDES